MAVPAFARIRAAFPDAHVTCGLRPYLRRLLDGSGFFDEFLELPKRRGIGAMSAFFDQVRRVRRGSFDLGIVLTNSLSSGWITRLGGVRWRAGYRQGRPFTMNLGLRAAANRGLLQRRVGPKRVPTPMPEYYAALLDAIGLPPGPDDAALRATPAERAAADRWFEERGLAPDDKLVLFNAGASYGPSKLWPEEHWVALAERYRATAWLPVFLAGPSEVDMVRRIAERAGVRAMIDPVVPLDVLKAFIERAALVVTTDTGPRHIALSMRVPVVCLIGPNDRRYTDYALDRQVVIQKALPCVPCQRKICPLGTGQCMRDIGVDEVFAAGQRLVAGG